MLPMPLMPLMPAELQLYPASEAAKILHLSFARLAKAGNIMKASYDMYSKNGFLACEKM